MSESMNFGNLGFSTVTEEEKKPTQENIVEEIEEVEVEEDEDINLEEMKRKDAEAAKDFEQAAGADGRMTNYEEDAANFSYIDFGPMKKYLDDDDITDISYSNGGQLWLKSLSKGVYRSETQDVDDPLIEKIAFQCSNIMGKTFNTAHPFLDSESAELRMNFVHNSIARNGIAVVFRKTPAKIRLEKQKLLKEKYIRLNIHEFLINCVRGHCNIIVCGETGSGKTELVKYLASHTAENEKIISIEDTLELHLDRIYPTRDIVAMKTNNIASYSDVLVTCMRQNPIWILLSEVRSAEAVTAVRNSISSGHYILSTIHADKAESIPHRMYSLLESNIDVEQFLKTIYRYVQVGIFCRGRYKPSEKRFVREIAGLCEFHVTDDEKAEFTNIYLKTVQGEETFQQPSKYLLRYLEGQGVDLNNLFGENKTHVCDGMDMSTVTAPKIGNGESTDDDNSLTSSDYHGGIEPDYVEDPTQNLENNVEQKEEETSSEEPVQEEVKEAETVTTEEANAEQEVTQPVEPEEVKQEQEVVQPVEQEEPKQEVVNEPKPEPAPAPVPKTVTAKSALPVDGKPAIVQAALSKILPAKEEQPRDLNVTVVEAIPEAAPEPVQEQVQQAAPDDIVARPLISVDSLVGGGDQANVEQNVGAAVPNIPVEGQPVVSEVAV